MINYRLLSIIRKEFIQVRRDPRTLAAVQSGPQGDFVQRVRGSLTESVPVTRGARQGDLVVVSGDLKSGDQVVVASR